MPIDDRSELPRPALAALRETLRAAETDEAIAAFLATVEGDPRSGAKALANRARRTLERREGERHRLGELLALRDRLVAEGVRGVAGIDEVGVGPLAGPVVAAAVVLPEETPLSALEGLDDSKRVRPAQRARLDASIREIAVGIGLAEVGPEEIDQIGIYQASLEAMRRAVASLARETEVGHLLVDARTIPGVEQPQTAIVKGDSRDASIAAASIVAKVHRDGLMETLDARYPGYGFAQHRGYGTADHLAALARKGPCPIHRRSFAPVEEAARRAARAAVARA